jgi:hypothetical protein
MSTTSVYQERAKHCAEQARLVTRADDRARWLQLANEWIAIGRLHFHRAPSPQQRGDASGLWRGQGLRRVREAEQ